MDNFRKRVSIGTGPHKEVAMIITGEIMEVSPDGVSFWVRFNTSYKGIQRGVAFDGSESPRVKTRNWGDFCEFHDGRLAPGIQVSCDTDHLRKEGNILVVEELLLK